jgi:ribulose-phosphate 3-epimerase
MMGIKVAPSLLACDLAHIADEVQSAEAAGADLLHFDVMDGRFVPNLTFGAGLCAAVRRLTTLPLDVHLMVVAPDALLEPFAEAGANRLSVHVEAVTHLHRTLTRVRELGMAPGVALNPATPLSVLEELWPWVNFVLVMTVNPGFGGQLMIPEGVDKVARLAVERTRRGSTVEIAVDGGIEVSNAEALRAAGANILVTGSAFFGASDRRRGVRALRGDNG